MGRISAVSASLGVTASKTYGQSFKLNMKLKLQHKLKSHADINFMSGERTIKAKAEA